MTPPFEQPRFPPGLLSFGCRVSLSADVVRRLFLFYSPGMYETVPSQGELAVA